MSNTQNIATPIHLTTEQECRVTLQVIKASELPAIIAEQGPQVIGWHGPESFKLETVETARNDRFGSMLYSKDGDEFEWSMPADWTLKLVTADAELAAELAA